MANLTATRAPDAQIRAPRLFLGLLVGGVTRIVTAFACDTGSGWGGILTLAAAFGVMAVVSFPSAPVSPVVAALGLRRGTRPEVSARFARASRVALAAGCALLAAAVGLRSHLGPELDAAGTGLLVISWIVLAGTMRRHRERGPLTLG